MLLTLFVLLTLCLTAFNLHGDNSKTIDNNSIDNTKFIKSFINYYDFSIVGRYTHEYHPYIFEKSSYSLDDLENSLISNNLKLRGRIVLTGYEEQAVPSYFTNYRVCTGLKINDEAKFRGKKGWVEQPHNKFGVMTGFLFKNTSQINEIHNNMGKDSLFEHINLELMPIFNYKSHIFRRHAFGDTLILMREMRIAIEEAMFDRDQFRVFDSLVDFWMKLYEYELRFGSRNVLGTQDILFAVEHGRHIARSKVPLLKYYVGPDITYPIKVTKLQMKEATYNAQKFVKKFVKDLKPVDNKNTVYIFCSFVDGVGKSTLLGNVKNYKKYGDNIFDYDHVDNTSSQLSQIYQCDNKVFIADLPAQMSHFTYKPDGKVYLDIMAARQIDQNSEQDNLDSFVKKNNKNLVATYKKNVEKISCDITGVTGLPEAGLPEAGSPEAGLPEKEFIKNLILLKKVKENLWVPFRYKEDNYLFNSKNLKNIRKLVDLDIADSRGLKNCEPEQMLFSHGIRFPLNYEDFVCDLINKLKKIDIENVVFVNFLSMYPRSSRENIRVNYLLQQISLLYDNFQIKGSLYDSFVNDAHLLYRLNKENYYGELLSAFQRETLVRFGLYKLMQTKDLRTVEGISIKTITSLLKDNINSLSKDEINLVENDSKIKLSQEKRSLEKVHGMTKEFINVQCLEFDDVIKFCEKLQRYFDKHVTNERIELLWQEPGTLIFDYDGPDGLVDKTIAFSDGTVGQLLYVIDPGCKNETLLLPIVRMIRASWYSAIINLVFSKSLGDKSVEVLKEHFLIPPLFVRMTENNKIIVFRRAFELDRDIVGVSDNSRDNNLIKIMNIEKIMNLRWGVFGVGASSASSASADSMKYLLSIDRAITDKGMFAFCCDTLRSGSHKWPSFGTDVSHLASKYKDKIGPNKVILSKKLWEKLKKDSLWKGRFERTIKQARRNSKLNKKDSTSIKYTSIKYTNIKDDNKKNNNKWNGRVNIKLGDKEKKGICEFVVRALATLEMIIKDPNSEIAVRKGSRKDFIAALKLIEKIILPTYCDVIFEKDLFSDYDLVRPVIKDIELN